MNKKTGITLIIGTVIILLVAWAWFDWGGRTSDFTTPASTEKIKNLMASRGLQTCKESGLTLHATPGFVAGKALTVSSDCATDRNPLKVTLLQFESEEARNAAQQRAAGTHRNGFGPHFVYSYGPYLISIQGTRGIGDQLLLGKVLDEAGARP